VITSFNHPFGLVLMSGEFFKFCSILIPSVFLAALYVFAAWSTGHLLLKKFSKQNGLVTSYVMGHASLGIFIQLVAVAGMLRWYILLPLLSSIILANWRINGLPKLNWQENNPIPKSRLTQILIFGLGVLVILTAFLAFSFPGTDALAYYMAQPKLIAATNKYIPLSGYDFFAVLPAIAEMPYAVMYSFGGDTIGLVAAKLSIWPVFVAVLSLLWLLARGIGIGVEAAWIFVVLGATSTAITLVAWDGKTDLVGLMYGLTAILWIPGLLSKALDKKLLWLFGFMAACAIMTKFSYLLIFPFCMGIPLFLLWRRHPRLIFYIVINVCFASCCAFTLGWWAKNYFLFGDPLAPVFSFLPSTPKFPLEQIWFNPDNTRWIFTTYPLALTFGLYPMQHGGVSAIWLMLIPSLWMRPWQSETGRKALYLSLGGIAAILAWSLLRPSVIAPRYFMPALLLPCLILVFGYEKWLTKKRMWAVATLVASLVILAFHIDYAYAAYRTVTLPFVSALQGKVGATPLFDRANRLASDSRSGVRVLLLSYSSEMLPSKMIGSFLPYTELKKSEHLFDWALRNKVDYIVYDPITHKGFDLDKLPPSGLTVEKIEYAPKVYYLYVLNRTDITQ